MEPIEHKTQPVGSVGGPFGSPVQTAVANAIQETNCDDLYQVPFTPDRIIAAVNERASTVRDVARTDPCPASDEPESFVS